MEHAFNLVAVSVIVLAGLIAVMASQVQSVLVGLPARAWQRWRAGKASGPALEAPLPLRPDLPVSTADFATATRALLDELLHARLRVRGWSDGERPGAIARWLGYRSDDDYGPTIEFFGEVARWLQHASELPSDGGVELPEVLDACARVRGLALADGELAPRVDGIIDAIRELDTRFSASASSPYRDRRVQPPSATAPRDDEDEKPPSRTRVLTSHEDVFRRIAARYANDESAREDLRQEIRLAVWLALPKHRGEASLSTYVRRIAQYCGARFGRRRFEPACIEELRDPAPSVVERLADAQRREALRAALQALPSPQREALELLLSGASYREVARHLGISESNASVRITRARKRLRRQLEPVFA